MSEAVVTLTSSELADLIRRAFKTDGWLTVKEAAVRARTKLDTVYGWIRNGKLVAYKPDGMRTVVPLGEVDRLIRKNRVVPGD